MKRISWIVVPISLLTFLILMNPFSTPPMPKNLIPAMNDAPKIGDDPNGRLHWEWLRQRDPASGEIPTDMARREQEFSNTLPQRANGETVGGIGVKGEKVEDWSFRGPWNIGGRTRALAIDVSDPSLQTLLAGGVSGGMWRTTDDGAHWDRVTGGSSLHNITCVAQDSRPGHETTWYYGTGEGRGYSPNRGGGTYTGDGIFKSVDGGLTWNILSSTSTGMPQVFDNPFNFVYRLVVDASNTQQDEVYAATAGAIYRSIDGGENWDAVLGSAENPSYYSDLVINSEGVLYATLSSEGTDPGIHRSPDGVNWTDISPDLIDGYGRITMDVAPSLETVAYFLVSSPESSANKQMLRYQYLSGSGQGSGGDWTELSSTLSGQLSEPDPIFGEDYYYWSQRGYNMFVSVNPADFNSVTIGGVHMYRNTIAWFFTSATRRVGGWYYRNRSHHADNHKLVYQPGSSSVAYSATDGGVFKTLDMTAHDVEWTSLNNGLNTTQFFAVALDPELPGNNVVLGGTQDNGTLWTPTTDQQSSWVEIFGGDGAHCAVLDGGPMGDYLVSYYRGNMFRILVDENGDVLEDGSIKPETGGEYLFINPFINDPADENVVYLATSNGVMRNTDVTAIELGSWDPTDVNWGQLTNEPAGDSVSALGTNGQNGHALYYGTATGGLYRVDDALNAPNNSTPLPLHFNGNFPEESYISGIAVHPQDDQKVLVTMGNYMLQNIWYSENGGASWIDVEGNLAGDDGPSVRCAEIMPSPLADLWFIGTTTGLYSANLESGQEVIWTREAPESIGNVIVDDLAVRLSDRKLVVGTHGRGIHSVHVPTPTAVPTHPGKTMLTQNHPNPFNPSTRIEFELPTAGAVKLEVFDLAGHLVKVLVDGTREAGLHHVSWNGTDAQGTPVGAGVYLYRLQAGSTTEQRKMTLVK